MTRKPQMAITVGDPAGIGPEVTAKALGDPAIRELADFVVFGDHRLWQGPGGRSMARFAFRRTWVGQFAAAEPGITLVEFPDIDYSEIPPGKVSAAGGRASVAYLMAAIDAVRADETSGDKPLLDGLVTGPINKEALREAGYPWPGHTELLAEKFGAGQVAMLFAGGPLRVVLATIHMSLADVLKTLDAERILTTLRLADDALKRFFGLAAPRIAVCGLNPHAGEAGRFGDEEARIIMPAIEAARGRGIDAHGPLPADTVYRAALEGKWDLVVAMYHDQGLIPVKTVAFEESVNITIGIPAIRTSVDHGTAFDIAGRNQADPASMASAIRMAVEMYHAGRGRT